MPLFQYGRRLCWQGCRVIRLIRLWPVHHDGPPDGRGDKDSNDSSSLAFSLQEVNLDTNPTYDALSYCWGAEQPEIPSLCEGQQFHVTKSLACALNVLLSQAANPFYLWVDAICINQSDNEEKNVQVAMMQDIYMQAQKVHVWLGKDTPDNTIRLAFNFLEAICRSFVVRKDDFAGTQDFEGRLRSWLNRLPLSATLSWPKWKALAFLINLPWFSRVWIVQEVVLCRDAVVYCDTSQMEWTHLLFALLMLQQRRMTQIMITPNILSPSDPVSAKAFATHRFIQLCAQHRFNPTECDLFDCLVNHRGAQATDPRDKIYGLLGLLTDNEAYGVKPNYTLTKAETYKQVAVTLVERRQYLDILAVQRPCEADESLPSWVPDWSVSLNRSYILSVLLDQGTENFLQASSGTLAEDTYAIVGDYLYVEGFVFDRVERLGSVIGLASNISTQGLSEATWLSSCLQIASIATDITASLAEWRRISGCRRGLPYAAGGDSYEVFLRTLGEVETSSGPTLGQLRGQWRVYGAAELWIWCLQLIGLDVVAPPVYVVAVTLGAVILGALKFPLTGHLWPVISDYVAGNRFVRTEKGYIGFVPPGTEVGDAVVLVKGCRVPLILRQTGELTWELIGPAYITGLMKGEQWDAGKCQLIALG